MSDLTLIKRIMWWVQGEVAGIVVEEYDDTFDAVSFPLFVIIVMGCLLYGGYGLLELDALGSTLAATVLAIGSGILSALLILYLLATVTYFTEPTEIDDARW